MYDLHTHTLLSDGELLPCELIRRMAVLGYETLAITDHADLSNMSEVLSAVRRVERSAEEFGVRLIPGIEITHVPPVEIPVLARRAKEEGADIVVVHGETVVEPVPPGTNMAACSCEFVDVLAHPGFISPAEGEMAYQNKVMLEITARGGHNRTNGYVVQIAEKTGCRLVVDSDAHGPGDLMTKQAREQVIRGAGVQERYIEEILTLPKGRFI